MQLFVYILSSRSMQVVKLLYYCSVWVVAMAIVLQSIVVVTQLRYYNNQHGTQSLFSRLHSIHYRLIKNETGRAILRVIAGPRAFKVVLFCRLTPIPFGLQNTIFGVSNWRKLELISILITIPSRSARLVRVATTRPHSSACSQPRRSMCTWALRYGQCGTS